MVCQIIRQPRGIALLCRCAVPAVPAVPALDTPGFGPHLALQCLTTAAAQLQHPPSFAAVPATVPVAAAATAIPAAAAAVGIPQRHINIIFGLAPTVAPPTLAMQGCAGFATAAVPPPHLSPPPPPPPASPIVQPKRKAGIAAAAEDAAANGAAAARKPPSNHCTSKTAAAATTAKKKQQELSTKYSYKTTGGSYRVRIKSKAAAQRVGCEQLYLGHHTSGQQASMVVDALFAGIGLPPVNNPHMDHSSHPLAQRLRRGLKQGASREELRAAVRKVLGLRENDKKGIHSTEFIGVKKVGCSRFKAHMRVASHTYTLGTYPTAEQAARVYDRAVAILRGAKAALNFPGEVPARLPPPLELAMARGLLQGRRGEQLLQLLSAACRALYKSRCSSAYAGVCFDKVAKKWQMRVSCAGERHYGGMYGDEVSAARMYDRAVLYRQHLGLAKLRSHQGDVLNFPEEDYEGDALLLQAKADGVGFAEFVKRCREVAATATRERGSSGGG